MDNDLRNRFYRYKRDALYPPAPAEPYVPPLTKQEWRDRYRVRLAWSNPNADDAVLLRKALMSESWTIVLSAARLFGALPLESAYMEYLSEESDNLPQWKRDFLAMLIGRAKNGRFE